MRLDQLEEKRCNDRPSGAAGAAAPAPLPPARRRLYELLGRPGCMKLLFLCGDILGVVAAYSIALFSVEYYLHSLHGGLSPSSYYWLYIPFFAVTFYLFDAYKAPSLVRPEKELELIFKASTLYFLTLFGANFVFLKSLGFSRYLMVIWYCLTLLFVLFNRFVLRTYYMELWRRGLARQKALLIGSMDRLEEYQKRLSIQRHAGYHLVGIVSPGAEEDRQGTADPDWAWLGSLDRWEEVALHHRVHLVIISLPATSEQSRRLVLQVLRRCMELKIDCELHSEVFGSSDYNYELDDFSGFFRFYAMPRRSLVIQRAVKEMLDRFIGLVGSIVTVLLTPLVGLLIKLEDRGSVFYWREFVGCDGNMHYYFKFRTMLKNADQELHNNPELKAKFDEKCKLEDDPRVLRIGRWLRRYSIDEFPQFFSLLAGRLSFVGPRVICRDEKARYGALLPKLLSAKPGMTGFWQVMGRQTTTYEERVHMDMFYIDHWSIWLDLVIIAKTFWKVIRAEGAY